MRYFLLATTCAILVSAQTTINGGRTVLGQWDATRAVSTKPAKMDTALPESCSSGEMFLKSGSAPSQMLYVCAAANHVDMTPMPCGMRPVPEAPGTEVVDEGEELVCAVPM